MIKKKTLLSVFDLTFSIKQLIVKTQGIYIFSTEFLLEWL